MRVGDQIEDHKPRVEGDGPPRPRLRCIHGMRVSADPRILFKDGDVVLVAQEVRAAEAGDTGADDGE